MNTQPINRHRDTSSRNNLPLLAKNSLKVILTRKPCCRKEVTNQVIRSVNNDVKLSLRQWLTGSFSAFLGLKNNPENRNKRILSNEVSHRSQQHNVIRLTGYQVTDGERHRPCRQTGSSWQHSSVVWAVCLITLRLYTNVRRALSTQPDQFAHTDVSNERLSLWTAVTGMLSFDIVHRF